MSLSPLVQSGLMLRFNLHLRFWTDIFTY